MIIISTNQTIPYSNSDNATQASLLPYRSNYNEKNKKNDVTN
jgi:hypothetical protein